MRGRTAQRTERTAQTKLGRPACHPPKLFSFFLFFFFDQQFIQRLKRFPLERERVVGMKQPLFIHIHRVSINEYYLEFDLLLVSIHECKAYSMVTDTRAIKETDGTLIASYL